MHAHHGGCSLSLTVLRIGNEFLPSDLIAEISAEECRDHKMIVLTPTPGLRPILVH
ncbi:hypothetical protein [Bradyrhizobium sp. DASA03007]|uniref:hypothetical protein n=1 Tax=unclassified Bradyrhizobium TaxID=2631580 RepID=UPI003F72DC79